MRILAIETSCDDTSIALIEGHNEKIRIIKEINHSQIDIHKLYGGIVPEVAARAHAEIIVPLLEKVFLKRKIPDAVAVTSSPGLITSLIIGVETARSFSALAGIPLISVNHIEGHIYSNWIKTEPTSSNSRNNAILFPALCLVVSGGHTELILMKKHLCYKKIGATRDDAAGEAFDKVAKLLGLEYPGGPKISALAKKGNKNAVKLPRPMINSEDYEFSFAGLKTAALYHIQNNKKLTDKKNEKMRADFCASFEQAIIEVLVTKTIRATKEYDIKSILLCGGVAANMHLRESLNTAVTTNLHNVYFHVPSIEYCMDNAAMIGAAGYFKTFAKKYTKWEKIQANPEWEL